MYRRPTSNSMRRTKLRRARVVRVSDEPSELSSPKERKPVTVQIQRRSGGVSFGRHDRALQVGVDSQAAEHESSASADVGKQQARLDRFANVVIAGWSTNLSCVVVLIQSGHEEGGRAGERDEGRRG